MNWDVVVHRCVREKPRERSKFIAVVAGDGAKHRMEVVTVDACSCRMSSLTALTLLPEIRMM